MVLMQLSPAQWAHGAFQYSLCRVVLMVQRIQQSLYIRPLAFSTRSVESF